MAKLCTFFLFLLVGVSILGGIMKGGGGIVATPLTADIGATNTTIPVESTDDYLSRDYVFIGEEQVLYTGTTATTFTGCTRGYDGTTAAAHSEGAMVYTADASAVNSAMGFNIAAVTDSMGWWGAITIPFRFFFQTIPRIFMMNVTFMTGNLAIIGWFWFAFVAGFVITLALALAGRRRV